MMIEVGIYEAKANLSAIVRRILQGEECIITQRGKPVVRMERADVSLAAGRKQSFTRMKSALSRAKLGKDWRAVKKQVEAGRR